MNLPENAAWDPFPGRRNWCGAEGPLLASEGAATPVRGFPCPSPRHAHTNHLPDSHPLFSIPIALCRGLAGLGPCRRGPCCPRGPGAPSLQQQVGPQGKSGSCFSAYLGAPGGHLVPSGPGGCVWGAACGRRASQGSCSGSRPLPVTLPPTRTWRHLRVTEPVGPAACRFSVAQCHKPQMARGLPPTEPALGVFDWLGKPAAVGGPRFSCGHDGVQAELRPEFLRTGPGLGPCRPGGDPARGGQKSLSPKHAVRRCLWYPTSDVGLSPVPNPRCGEAASSMSGLLSQGRRAGDSQSDFLQ